MSLEYLKKNKSYLNLLEDMNNGVSITLEYLKKNNSYLNGFNEVKKEFIVRIFKKEQ